MSVPFRFRSQRAIRTLQNAAQTPCTLRAPNQRIGQVYNPMARRAITYSQNRNQAPTKPSPTAPTTSIPKASSPSATSTTPASRVAASTPSRATTENISKSGLSDKPLELETPADEKIDWTRSFHGLSASPFPKEAADILLAETDPMEVEIKPDGILYLPEIKYRRILNRAFGPGGWGLVPRSESIVTPKTVTREYALVCNGR